MNDSILLSIKKLIGIDESYKHFDEDLIIHINSVFAILTQLGVGPENGFKITGESETWNDYMDDPSNIEHVKTYLYLRVKLIFDPPSASHATDSMKNVMSEMEWRLYVGSESQNERGENN